MFSQEEMDPFHSSVSQAQEEGEMKRGKILAVAADAWRGGGGGKTRERQ